MIGGLYPPPDTTIKTSTRIDAAGTQVETAQLTSGTVIRIITNDPAYLDDIGPALDELVTAAG